MRDPLAFTEVDMNLLEETIRRRRSLGTLAYLCERYCQHPGHTEDCSAVILVATPQAEPARPIQLSCGDLWAAHELYGEYRQAERLLLDKKARDDATRKLESTARMRYEH